MQIFASSPQEYLAALPPERQAWVGRLAEVLQTHLPPGFEYTMGSGMLAWVVPYSLYPAGYHCPPAQPLPFLALASQSSSVNLYHMGLYSDPGLLEWFQQAWAASGARKLDMGKSCIRLKSEKDTPWEVLGALAAKMTPQDWIARYEALYRPDTRKKNT